MMAHGSVSRGREFDGSEAESAGVDREPGDQEPFPLRHTGDLDGGPPELQYRRLSENVERAFDLLGHNRDLLKPGFREPRSPDIDHALTQLEEVLRKELPRAHAARDPLIDGVLAIVGDRPAAQQALAGVDLRAQRILRLKELATALCSQISTVSDSASVCRDAIHQWRSFLPTIRRTHDGRPDIDESDHRTATLPGRYWSSGLESRPSRLGASLLVAEICGTLAVIARRKGVPVSSIRPALHLAQRLRECPDWPTADPHTVVGALEKQLALSCDVLDLLAELEIVSLPPDMQGGSEQEHETPHAPKPNPEIKSTSTPDPNVNWVPSSSCIDDMNKDATAVRRFCEKHGVLVHRLSKRRLLVDRSHYQAAKRAVIHTANKEFDSIAERRQAEIERRNGARAGNA